MQIKEEELMSKPSMRPLFTRKQIADRIRELGAQISKDYAGKEILAIGVLKGSIVFLGDLVREIDSNVVLDFIGVSSYVGTASTGEVRITHDLGCELVGKDVLLIEDIIDSGRTIDFLLDMLALRKPRSLKVAAFLSKPEAHIMHHKIDYVGFEIGREFVVGYGLDLDGNYRNLPDLMQIGS